jgi:hypothetical protein
MADSPMRGMLPPIYQPLFDAFFDRPKIEETRATCDNCAMCNQGDAASPVAMEYFRPDTKCCTYFPQLPNYLVGAILSDPSPDSEEGKRRIREQIRGRMGATPHYLSRPRKMSLILQNYSAGFGRAQSLRCPYFDLENPEKSCTIWRHRETICMTYYCKYVGGQRGFDFWVSFKNYLGYVQRKLVKVAANAVDENVVEPKFSGSELTLEDIEDLPPKDTDYARWWGTWVGREEEFYVKCHEWLKSTTAEEFAVNIDKDEHGKRYFEDVIAKYEKHQSKLLPANLVRNGRMREAHVGDKVVVTTYHRYDSFALDKDLYEVVGLFRADETLEQNIARLKAEGIELAPDLIEYLFAAGVLVEPSAMTVADAKTGNAAALEGRRTALGAVLRARGIAVDDPSFRKIAAADVAGLDALIARAATAEKVADLFVESEAK